MRHDLTEPHHRTGRIAPCWIQLDNPDQHATLSGSASTASPDFRVRRPRSGCPAAFDIAPANSGTVGVMVELIGCDGTVCTHEIGSGGSNTAECSAATVGLTLAAGHAALAGRQTILLASPGQRC
jgi:hypothetical protein